MSRKVFVVLASNNYSSLLGDIGSVSVVGVCKTKAMAILSIKCVVYDFLQYLNERVGEEYYITSEEIKKCEQGSYHFCDKDLNIYCEVIIKEKEVE